jgi:hypothetical protein
MLFVDAGNNRIGMGTDAPAKTLDVRGSMFIGASGSTVSRSRNGLGISYTNDNSFASNADIGDTNRYFAITNDSSTENDYAAIALRVNPNQANGVANAMMDMKLVSQAGTASKFVMSMRNGETAAFQDALTVDHRGTMTLGRYGAFIHMSRNSNSTEEAITRHVKNVGTGASGTDVAIMRVKRGWWGGGNFEIRVKGTYYAGSDDTTFQLQGHSSIQYNGTMSATMIYGDTSSRIYMTARQTASPADAYIGYQDVYITVPAHNAFTIEIITSRSTWHQTDAELANDFNGYRLF